MNIKKLPNALFVMGARALFFGSLVFPRSADAQSASSPSLDYFRPETLISAYIPAGFDRGGNVSIDQQPHPGYESLAVNIGSFVAYPTIETFVGGSSNALLQQHNPKGDLLLGGAISVFAKADFGTSSFTVYGRDFENVWVNTPTRSQDEGNVDASYQFDISNLFTAAVEGDFTRYGDNNPIGTLNNLEQILEITTRTFAGARIQYQSGQLSQIVSVDRTQFKYDSVYSIDTGLEENSASDHTVNRISSQTEYAFTPSVAAFGQLSLYNTSYAYLLPGNIPNFNSFSVRAIAGISLDLPGLLRGQISAGFAHRSYESSNYKTPTGLVIASKLDFFLDTANNFTLLAKKEFDDGSVYSSTPVKYTQINLSYEHELRVNWQAGFSLNYLQLTSLNQIYSDTKFVDYGTALYTKYSLNRHVSVRFECGFEREIVNQVVKILADFRPNTEFRGQFTLTYRP